MESKILVVALLLVIILLGLAVFLFFIEKKISRLESKLREIEEKGAKRE